MTQFAIRRGPKTSREQTQNSKRESGASYNPPDELSSASQNASERGVRRPPILSIASSHLDNTKLAHLSVGCKQHICLRPADSSGHGRRYALSYCGWVQMLCSLVWFPFQWSTCLVLVASIRVRVLFAPFPGWFNGNTRGVFLYFDKPCPCLFAPSFLQAFRGRGNQTRCPCRDKVTILVLSCLIPRLRVHCHGSLASQRSLHRLQALLMRAMQDARFLFACLANIHASTYGLAGFWRRHTWLLWG